MSSNGIRPSTVLGGGSNGKTKDALLYGPSGELIHSRAPQVTNEMIYGRFGASGYGQYGASLTKNSLVGWRFWGGDADTDILENVQILRERSRDAFMGVPLATGAVEVLSTDVIGTGLSAQPNVDGEALNLSVEETAVLNRDIATKFGWWADNPRECDFEAKYNFATLQHLAFQTTILSGDAPTLLPLKPRKDTLYDLRVRVLESDRVCDPWAYDLMTGGNIFGGVEISEDGEVLAYHVSNIHPLARRSRQAVMTETIRVEPYGARTGRRNMLLMMKPERPEQRRGVPLLAVVLENLKQNGRYIESVCVAAILQSYFTAFITSAFPAPELLDMLTEEQKRELAELNPYNVQLGPGIINFLRPGSAVNFAQPTQPTTSFGDFTIGIAKFVGCALGIPYEILLKQFNASYSASRAALLEFWKRVKKWRRIVVEQFCQPIYEEWFDDALALGLVKLPFAGGFDDPYIKRALCRANWIGSAPGSIDPVKEVDAAERRVKGGFSTGEREAAELNGSDYRDNTLRRGVEKQLNNSFDLTYPGEAAAAAPVAEPPAIGDEPTPEDEPPEEGEQTQEGDEEPEPKQQSEPKQQPSSTKKKQRARTIL